MFLYEGTDIRKGTSYEYEFTKSHTKSDFNGNFDIYDGDYMDDYEKKQHEPKLNLEFDGTTVLCRVCGDKASGFHYGVHSCEGCKGFFRRSIQQKIQYRPCTKNQQCSILRINRNRCQYCRLKKCIAVGMSRDAVRFGRVPKREKARILAAMQQSTNSRSQEKALTAELEDDQRLLATVVRAHLETCDFTRDKVEPMLIRARTQPSFTACPPTLACPLNPNPQPLTGQQELLQDFSKRFSPAIRGVVEFAKRITGFALLPQDDQVTLLKAGVFEVLLVRLACMFDAQNNTMICLNGQVLKRDSIHNSSNARFLMDSMFDFAERLNSLHLSDAEIGLFSSIVVIAADRPGLRNVELIEKMHNKLKALLQSVLAQNHPTQPNLCQELIKKIPDLRTLNTLHSEKLLAFKMTEQQQLQQQHNLWNGSNGAVKYKQEPIDYHRGLDDCGGTKSPVGSSSWSSSSEGGAMEEVKSPMGSVSSTESACSGEVAALNENAATVASIVSGHQAANAPLLAATLAAGVCPMRRRQNSIGSMSGDDDATNAASLHAHPHLHMKLQQQQQQQHHQLQLHHHHQAAAAQQHLVSHKSTFPRKLDSPCDSGIESGTEKIEKLTNSAPTSVCSSPRSSLEDKDEHNHHHHQQQQHHHHQHHHHNSNSSSMHHNGNQSVNNQQNGGSGASAGQSIDDMPVLKRVLQAPPLYDTNSLMDEAYKPHKKFRALRNKDTAEAEPIVVVTHNGSLSGGNSSSSGNQPQSQLQHHLTSSLSSTHSTLAKSLMEGPRMTPEQMKRTDIIHNFIMRGADALESTSQQSSSGSSSGSSTSSRCSPNQQIYYVPQPAKWEQNGVAGELSTGAGTIGVGTSVITSSGRPQVSSSPYLNTVVRSQSLSPHGEPITKIYLRGTNLSPPTCLSSSSSPVHFLHSQSPGLSQSPPMHVQSPIHRQSPMHSHSPPHSNHSPSVSPPAHMMSTVNLQVGITNSSQQPLNLSKKTPPSSPRPISASTTTPKIVSLEA